MSDHHHPLEADAEGLAGALAPVLVAACDGRLTTPTWFRAAWQAGGASTGYARYRCDDGVEREVVVKVPVKPTEYRWTTALGNGSAMGGNGSDGGEAARPITPRVLAHGLEVGGYDLAWLVIEKLDGAPLSRSLDKASVEDLLLTAAKWYGCAAAVRPVQAAPRPTGEDWAAMIERARQVAKDVGMADGQRWNEALKQVQRTLGAIVARWEAREIATWCHGDLHPGNAMRRAGDTPGQGCVLIDLAMVHPGHWVEDALYLERLYWGKPDMLCGVKPVSQIARHLREAGRLGNEDYAQLAHCRRVLMAATVPLYLEHEGHPRYVHAALEILEKTLPLVGR